MDCKRPGAQDALDGLDGGLEWQPKEGVAIGLGACVAEGLGRFGATARVRGLDDASVRTQGEKWSAPVGVFSDATETSLQGIIPARPIRTVQAPCDFRVMGSRNEQRRGRGERGRPSLAATT